MKIANSNHQHINSGKRTEVSCVMWFRWRWWRRRRRTTSSKQWWTRQRRSRHFQVFVLNCNFFWQIHHCYFAKEKIRKFFFFFIVFAPRMLASALVRDQITLRRRSLWNTITTTMLISSVFSWYCCCCWCYWCWSHWYKHCGERWNTKHQTIFQGTDRPSARTMIQVRNLSLQAKFRYIGIEDII